MLKKKLFPCSVSTAIYRKGSTHSSKHSDCVGSHSVLQGLYVPFAMFCLPGMGGDLMVRIGRKDACREDGEELRWGEGCERNFTSESSSFDQREQLFVM